MIILLTEVLTSHADLTLPPEWPGFLPAERKARMELSRSPVARHSTIEVPWVLEGGSSCLSPPCTEGERKQSEALYLSCTSFCQLWDGKFLQIWGWSLERMEFGVGRELSRSVMHKEHPPQPSFSLKELISIAWRSHVIPEEHQDTNRLT